MTPQTVAALRLAYENAQSLLHVEACLTHYGRTDWDKVRFVAVRHKPTREQWLKALQELPADTWRLTEALEFLAMQNAGWTVEEIKSFKTARQAELEARGLYICMWSL